MGARDVIRYFRAIGDVGDHQSRALGGERMRIVLADALGPAGDDGDAAIQTPHDPPSPFSTA